MNIEEIRTYCLSKRGVTEEFPFDESTLVYKVMGKMFLLTDLGSELWVNLKCNPSKAVELRERYACVQPGFHMKRAMRAYLSHKSMIILVSSIWQLKNKFINI